jgi:heme exporter protein D
MSEFLAMGGYAAFVWPCYAASAIVIGLMILASLRSHARAQADVRALETDAKGGPL